MIDIDKLDKLEKAATPGPWTYRPLTSGTLNVNRGWALRGPDTRRIFWDDTGSGASIEGDDADIDLVLTVRSALPELLAEVRRLRADLRTAVDLLYAVEQDQVQGEVWYANCYSFLDALAAKEPKS